MIALGAPFAFGISFDIAHLAVYAASIHKGSINEIAKKLQEKVRLLLKQYENIMQYYEQIRIVPHDDLEFEAIATHLRLAIKSDHATSATCHCQAKA